MEERMKHVLTCFTGAIVDFNTESNLDEILRTQKAVVG
jgi:hypothetical protein